ncbi:hypothetical protein ACJZ2D_016576 [Fusarium nematophilum]
MERTQFEYQLKESRDFLEAELEVPSQFSVGKPTNRTQPGKWSIYFYGFNYLFLRDTIFVETENSERITNIKIGSPFQSREQAGPGPSADSTKLKAIRSGHITHGIEKHFPECSIRVDFDAASAVDITIKQGPRNSMNNSSTPQIFHISDGVLGLIPDDAPSEVSRVDRKPNHALEDFTKQLKYLEEMRCPRGVMEDKDDSCE